MLSGALILLVTTTVVMHAMHAPSTVSPTPPSASAAIRGGTVRITVPSTESPASIPAGAPRSPDGCGLTLHAGASVAPMGSCTVLEIGDSLGNDLGWGLAREDPAGSGLKLVQLDKSSTGLADSGYYDWPGQLASDLALLHPQLVLICLGGNDEQGMEVDGSPVQFPTPSWQRAYLTRVRQLVTEATASGAFVLWVGLPVMQDPEYDQGVQVLNALYQQAVDTSADATFVSSWGLFGGPQGVFSSAAAVNGTLQDLREPDGIHLSLTGENVMATFVIAEMASLFHVQLAAVSPDVITAW